MHPSVLLLHTLADGSSHYDWMIRRPDGRGLVTFRVPDRLDQPGATFEAERLPDHRVEYLEYEGEVSGNRGRVVRVAQGAFEIVEDTPDAFCVRGHLGARRVILRGTHLGDNRWRFAIEQG